jgi:hypothetical protein
LTLKEKKGQGEWSEAGEAEGLIPEQHLGSERKEHPTHSHLNHPLCLKMEKFRSLLFTSEDDERIHMVDNFRPPQPLKGRVVKASFQA